MSMFRGFIAIDIKPTKEIVEFVNELRKTGSNLKLVEPENIHITLRFLGDTNEQLVGGIEKIIKSSITGIKPFNIQLKGAGVFPNSSYVRVVWIGIQNGEQIADISTKIDEQIVKLGFEKEKRKFSSHLTIARVRSAKNKDRLLQIVEKYRGVEFADLTVDSICFKKSVLTPKGPIYTTLKEVKI